MRKIEKYTTNHEGEEQNSSLLEATSVVRISLDRFIPSQTENGSSSRLSDPMTELPGSVVASVSRNTSIVRPGLSKSDNSIHSVIIDPEFLRTLQSTSTLRNFIRNDTSNFICDKSQIIPEIVECFNSITGNEVFIQSQNVSCLQPENTSLFKSIGVNDNEMDTTNCDTTMSSATFSNILNKSDPLPKPNSATSQNIKGILDSHETGTSERISKCSSAPVRRDVNMFKSSRTGSCGAKSSKNEVTEIHLIPQESMSSVGSSVCRICMATGRERLISPCNCKGSMGGVHLTCLERWLSQVGRDHCELCGYRYPSVRTPRYTVIQALRLWFGNPRNRNHCQSDCLIFWLLSTVTIGLMAVCIVGTQYFVIEGNRLGISHRITETTMCFFMAIVLFGYFVTVFLLWKDHYVLWNRWRRANVNIRLIIDPNHLNQSVIDPA